MSRPVEKQLSCIILLLGSVRRLLLCRLTCYATRSSEWPSAVVMATVAVADRAAASDGNFFLLRHAALIFTSCARRVNEPGCRLYAATVGQTG